MRKFEAFVPVDLKVTLEARDSANASDKADYVTDYFLKEAGVYKLNLPGIGAVVLELVGAELEGDDDGAPDVHEVFETETQDKLGSLPPADISEPFYGTCLLPRKEERVTASEIAGANEEVWGGQPGTVVGERHFIPEADKDRNDGEPVNLGGDLRGDEWGTAAKHYVGG